MDGADEGPAVARGGVDVGELSPHDVVLAQHADGFVLLEQQRSKPDRRGGYDATLATAWNGVGKEPGSNLVTTLVRLLEFSDVLVWSGQGWACGALYSLILYSSIVYDAPLQVLIDKVERSL